VANSTLPGYIDFTPCEQVWDRVDMLLAVDNSTSTSTATPTPTPTSEGTSTTDRSSASSTPPGPSSTGDATSLVVNYYMYVVVSLGATFLAWRVDDGE
jgi:hypothetical protein